MAANKFATMLHRNAHRITVVLVYTVLEWILIILLLLNSLFSYLISKFASFFGLQTPCLWCSRVDHVLEPQKGKFSYRSLFCETHAKEISKLGYCSNHRKLAETCDMCEDCSSSRPSMGGAERRIAFFSLLSGDGASNSQLGTKDAKCSCCGATVDEGLYSPYLLLKPSWDVLDYAPKGNLVKEKSTEADNSDDFNDVKYLDPSKPDSLRDVDDDEIRKRIEMAENQLLSDFSEDKVPEGTEKMAEETDEKGALMQPEQDLVDDHPSMHLEGTTVWESGEDNGFSIQLSCREDPSFIILSPRSEHQPVEDLIVPIESVDSMTAKSHSGPKINNEDEQLSHPEEFDVAEPEIQNHCRPTMLVETTFEVKEETAIEEVESVRGNESSSCFPESEYIGDLIQDKGDGIAQTQEIQSLPGSVKGIEAVVKDSDEYSAFLDSKIVDTVINCENEDREACDEEQTAPHSHDSIPIEGFPKGLSLSDEKMNDGHQGDNEIKELAMGGGRCGLISQSLPENEAVERFEVEEDKAPETPTYLENIHSLHKKLLFERKESGTESLDGSVISDIEAGEVTIDRLKVALKAERKGLCALYSELEEERSASAIAANQTMAMITRLQEEKAAMQMEALQYQRMMEEQSEYDQEALQLLNELMMKREKEKQELEKELELYRKKVFHYEAKEKRMMSKKKYNGVNRTSSSSSSLVDSDELCVDLNEGEECDNGFHVSAQNTPTEEILCSGVTQESTKHLSTLEESLADFEEERLSILEQLKALEEKLFTLDYEEELFEDVKSIEHFTENGEVSSLNFEFDGPEENGMANGFSDEMSINGKLHLERRSTGSKAKRLLPLFDAISMENEEDLHEEQDAGVFPQSCASKTASEKKNLAIEEEVDHVYERLQALEADREFLKHCINSLKKGDKGMDLLQEILQHLRDLRTVELRVRSSAENLS
ncbi:myosin-binding protein 3-like [Aristolochia californica]|uniref:myosin-binding protein 3-like n=1 Tax=Aristolochia californica TaxID=171875 RepID=UPI0035D73445